IQGEVVRNTKLIDEVYNVFGLTYKIVLSTMPEDHIGTRGDWEKAEAALADAITSIGKTYEVNPGDGAFYGPKLDFHVTDSLGRVWQCGTIQLDYQLPGRFDLEYTDSNSEKQTPVMIHRVVYGSIERFIGVITEHFAGAFPTWLSPVQVKILPVTDRAYGYADGIKEKLEALGYRVEVDKRNEKTGRKIRDAQVEKVPYMIVVGDRDMEAGTLAPRHRSEGDLGTMSFDDFLALLKDDVDNKKIK
ncbi:MAG: threonine--tRNA ligase, partial [Firmicutes bacterium]|nr:threonine--tRNA ligase [Bacillota bacterium]